VQLVVATLISGQVIAAQARWTDDGAHIVTDAVVQTADGANVTVTQLGGEVGGLGQITEPGPVILAPGMQVSVDAHEGVTLGGRRALVVDDVSVARVAGDGAPWVREGPTPAGNYLFWSSGCIFMTYDAAGTTEIAGDAEFPIIDAAMQTWNTGIAGCGYQKLMGAGKTSGVEVGKDYINLVKFREDTWCIPASGSDPPVCHPAQAAGITTITYVKHPGQPDDGEIIDADVEINGVDFAISTGGVTLGSATCHADLGNTITHELGHVLGLEHTCVTPSDPPRVDNNGNPVPACPDAGDPTVTEATMYPYQMCGEIKKATLEPDDINGACSIYPAGKDPGTCAAATPPTGCCDSSGDSARSSLALSLAALLFFRRRSGSTASR
jgi:hypothetical protein